jgi:hypothetical protein
LAVSDRGGRDDGTSEASGQEASGTGEASCRGDGGTGEASCRDARHAVPIAALIRGVGAARGV